LAECSGSSSSRKVNIHPSLKSFASFTSCFPSIAIYLAASIFQTTLTSFPVFAGGKHTYSTMQIMLLLLYFRYGKPKPCFCYYGKKKKKKTNIKS
ncbi:hypothetical protein CHARACLAT_009280, partial [Characodon lateralis]|nr:hypothetical protein [Characodon lateralis]